MEGVVAMDAVFDGDWVKRLHGNRVKTGGSKMDLAEQLIADIEAFRTENECDRLVMVWCASTEAYRDVTAVHATIEAFEQAGRTELAAKEAAERDVIAAYAPEQPSEEAVDALVDEAIASTGATSMQQMGQVMGAIMGTAKGKVDGAAVQAKVKARLGG